MAMPASACPAVHSSVAQRSRLIPLSASPNSDESSKQSLYPNSDPNRHQNLIICSLAHCQPSLKIPCKSVALFLRKLANRQTNNEDYISSLAEVVKHTQKLSLQIASRSSIFNCATPPVPTKQPACTGWRVTSCSRSVCCHGYIIRRRAGGLVFPTRRSTGTRACTVRYATRRTRSPRAACCRRSPAAELIPSRSNARVSCWRNRLTPAQRRQEPVLFRYFPRFTDNVHLNDQLYSHLTNDSTVIDGTCKTRFWYRGAVHIVINQCGFK